MNNQKRRPNSGSIKTAGNNIISRKTETKNTILVRDTTNMQQGNGLWCINTDRNMTNLKKENLEKQKSEAKSNANNNNNNLNTEIINEFDRKIIENLKFKNKDLTEKLQKALSKAADMEYKVTRYESTMQNYIDLCEEKVEENKEITEKIEGLENNTMNLKMF